MNRYDDILKEEKKYAELTPIVKKSKFTKYFFIEFFAVLVCLVISYCYFYHYVLAPDKVFLYDLSIIRDMYKPVVEPLKLSFLNSDYNLEGSIQFDDYHYNYGMVRNDSNLKLSLSLDDKSFIYYLENHDYYLSYNQFNDGVYVKKNYSSLLSLYRSFNSNFSSVFQKDKFIKRFYFEGSKPIVEVSYVLDKTDMVKLFGGEYFSDDIEVLFTFKNNAFLGDISSLKVIINNKSKNTRSVWMYQDDEFTLTDNNGKVTKFHLDVKGEDFILKIIRDDVLYSIFTGTRKENSFHYGYQIIDKTYNLSLSVQYQEDSNIYEFHSEIEDMSDEKFTLSIIFGRDFLLDEDLSHLRFYSKLTDDEKRRFDSSFDSVVLPIREFIFKYKDGIY